MPNVYGSIIKDGVNYSHDTAESISFDNTSTSVAATDVQGAIEELASSSGSGGHTIVNDAGTDMTQRTDLQFSGVYVSDNSAGDITEVNVVRALTKAQIEALSGESLKGFQECTTEESDLPLTSDVVECANNQSLTSKLSSIDRGIEDASQYKYGDTITIDFTYSTGISNAGGSQLSTMLYLPKEVPLAISDISASNITLIWVRGGSSSNVTVDKINLFRPNIAEIIFSGTFESAKVYVSSISGSFTIPTPSPS